MADLVFGRQFGCFSSFQLWKRMWLRFFFVIFGLLMVSGCAQPSGPIFPPLAEPIVWPKGEAPARISYVGSLSTDRDLKAGKTLFDGIGETLFGKKSSHGMIAPYGVCTDGGDRVFVSDTGARLVHMFDLKT